MSGKKRSRTGGIWILAVVCVFVLAAGIVLEFFTPWLHDQDIVEATSPADLSVRINEVMTANASAIFSDLGESSDWVELMNTGSSKVNLKGYTLSEAGNIVGVFQFPNHVLEPGRTVVVYLDGNNRSTAGYVFHAPFKLSASGSGIELSNPDGVSVDQLDIPELSQNKVYRRLQDGTWEISDEYTPGMENTRENHLMLNADMAESPLEISEMMASNATYAPDSEGSYYDYIELHNTSGEALSLDGYFLSDNEDESLKWRFPDGISISGDGYLIVYASGLSGRNGADIHTGFKLSSSGESVVLSNPQRQKVAMVAYPAMETDQAYSLVDGKYTTVAAPTPGKANTTENATVLAQGFSSKNVTGVSISEIMAASIDTDYDWMEVSNASNQAVDISGWGLSDDTGKPRKWQFPEGTVLQPGQYMGIFMAGFSGQDNAGVLFANFRLASDGGYALTLSSPEGTVMDRVFVPEQYSGVSYSRTANGSFLYVLENTPNAANAQTGYVGKMQKPAASVAGGLYTEGERVEVALTAEPGATIYYTLDYQDPDESATLYTGPISVNQTTIVRARAYKNGMLPSYTESQSYFFGISHTMRVISLVADPENLEGETGIHSNYTQDWEREGHVEVFLTDGERMLSENCGLKLHGADSRKLAQKNFKVIARGEYGANSFDASLFSNRPYTQYQSFILRCSSEDGNKTRMRDSILTKLADGTGVYFQETEQCVVYINGQYWGHYNMRERTCVASICQFEGWEGQENEIDLVKANVTVMRGSDDSYQDMLAWVKQNGVKDQETLDKVGEVIDLDNYIAYHALQIFVGNADTLNVKRYRNANADGKWRWAIFDLDWGFYVDTNSINRWLEPGGMGSSKRTDNTLFIALMKNEVFRDRFITFIGEKMATTWTTENVLSMMVERDKLLQPELPMQFERWGESMSRYNSKMGDLANYAKARPSKLIGYFQSTLSMSDADLEKYFGAAIRKIQEGT